MPVFLHLPIKKNLFGPGVWAVGCFTVCISLFLSAQLYSSPHSTALHPLLPFVSLPLDTPLNLSFTLHLSALLSLPPHSQACTQTHKCNLSTYRHINVPFCHWTFFNSSVSPPPTCSFPFGLYLPPSLPIYPEIIPSGL